jgi:hypothetical protein
MLIILLTLLVSACQPTPTLTPAPPAANRNSDEGSSSAANDTASYPDDIGSG